MTEPIAVPRLFVPPIPLVGLVRVGVMDAELAALLSLTVEAKLASPAYKVEISGIAALP